VEPIGAKLSITPPRPTSAEPGAEQSSAKPSAKLSGTDLIIEPLGAEPSIKPPRLLSDEPSFVLSSFELSNAKPDAELSIAEQWNANPFVKQSRAEPSIKPPIPLSNELIVEHSSVGPCAKPIVEPSGAAGPSIEPPRPLSDEPTVNSSGELSAELSCANLIVEQSRAEPSIIERLYYLYLNTALVQAEPQTLPLPVLPALVLAPRTRTLLPVAVPPARPLSLGLALLAWTNAAHVLLAPQNQPRAEGGDYRRTPRCDLSRRT
jgi:hypothetical protein